MPIFIAFNLPFAQGCGKASCRQAGADATVPRSHWTLEEPLRVLRLEKKVALITGGGTGIGRACALAFAREGARVGVAGRRAEPLATVVDEIKRDGSEAVAVPCDVTNAASVACAIAATVEQFGALHVLVNNAGALLVADIEGTSEAEWDHIMAVNLKGTFLVSKAALPELRRAGGGAIVNIASILGIVAMKNRAAYTASKGGVIALTKSMALDHAKDHIRVNCICPTIVETELVENLFSAQPDPEAARQARRDLLPIGRLGKPEDVAHLAVYLASDESSFVTGAALPLDGRGAR
jgi:NAD(P)-dependent dehydrogenase (short-subunit alcohol dehydrogenase family)